MFEQTRPYNDAEIPAAVARVMSNPVFPRVLKYLFPEALAEEVLRDFATVTTTYDFQHRFMLKAILSIVAQTTDGLESRGAEKLEPSKRYMFVSNHRDIMLDAALLQIVLDANQLDTSEITFGNNLMQGELVIDLGKMNKMFRIVRGGTIHDFYRNSLEVSSYMRYALLEKRQSVWIAQRNGRTKDGCDKTEMALLKMFSISSEKPFVENLAELNITPVAISYEYEPCDFMKTQELYISRYQHYLKEPGEDLRSILHGVMQKKGGVSLCITPTLKEEELQNCDRYDKKYKFEKLAQIIDKRIYDGYKLWKNNYMAYDILHETNLFSGYYSADDKRSFVEYMESGLRGLQGDADELRAIFLGIYANSVKVEMGG